MEENNLGVAGDMTSRFARLRVHTAHRDTWRSSLRQEEWLVIEWPSREKEPIKYWLSTMPADSIFTEMIRTIKMRWRIERDYYELKQEIGLGHFEGRGWIGFHTIMPACVLQRMLLWSVPVSLFPPLDSPGYSSKYLPYPKVSARGAPPLRSERHIPWSLATIRRRLIIGLSTYLLRCPCCHPAFKE